STRTGQLDLRILELQVKGHPRHSLNPLAGTNHLDLIHELGRDLGALTEEMAKQSHDIVHRRLTIAAASDDFECDCPWSILHHLLLPHDVIEVFEDMSKERPRNVAAVGADDDGLHSSLNGADHRQTSPTRALEGGVHCLGEIADSIPDEGQTEVVEVRN